MSFGNLMGSGSEERYPSLLTGWESSKINGFHGLINQLRKPDV